MHGEQKGRGVFGSWGGGCEPPSHQLRDMGERKQLSVHCLTSRIQITNGSCDFCPCIYGKMWGAFPIPNPGDASGIPSLSFKIRVRVQ